MQQWGENAFGRSLNIPIFIRRPQHDPPYQTRIATKCAAFCAAQRPTDRIRLYVLHSGDSVDEALVIAATIGPDTVLLLSDGQIPSQKTLSFLLNGELRDFPVHTFAVGMGSSIAGRRNLQEIAVANGGEFREGETPEAMKALARERPRMYHDRLPGLVWGRNVRARR